MDEKRRSIGPNQKMSLKMMISHKNDQRVL